MVDLAIHEADGPASVRDIAARTALPQAYLEQIMLALKGGGLVTSKRGVRGGYLLARPPSEISLSEIVEATEGRVAPLGCAEVEPDHSCTEEGNCALQLVWVRVRSAVADILKSVTLADIAGQTIDIKGPSRVAAPAGLAVTPVR